MLVSRREAMGTRSNATGSTSAGRRARYARSSTVSVTQLLSDSCSSLLHRITNRVRGPSAAIESNRTPTAAVRHKTSRQDGVTSGRHRFDQDIENFDYRRHGREDAVDRERDRPVLTDSNIGATPRFKLDDSYTTFDKYVHRKERARERREYTPPSAPLAKSATSSTILLTEKAYPYVASIESSREKTPYRNAVDKHKPHRHHKARPLRAGCKSDLTDLKLSWVPIDNANISTVEDVPSSVTVAPLAIPEPSPVNEREAKRKEIQSLIDKYICLDDKDNEETLSAVARCQQKYSNILAASAVATASATANASTNATAHTVTGHNATVHIATAHNATAIAATVSPPVQSVCLLSNNYFFVMYFLVHIFL